MFSGFFPTFLKEKKTPGMVFLMLVLLSGVQAFGNIEADNFTLHQPGAFNYTGTYQLREIDPELTGKNVILASLCRSLTYIEGQPQNDYRSNIGHNCFVGRDVKFSDGFDGDTGLSQHSTAIGAILSGYDPNAYHKETGKFHYEGAAPDATVNAYEFWRFVKDYVFGAKEFEADILTMSIGEVFEDWWTRGIEHLAEDKGLIVVASIGNGDDVFDPVLYPGAGGNVIGVGVIDSVVSDDVSRGLEEFTLPRREHTSYGPTGDGRSKPDIVAPGNCLVPDANNTTGYQISGDWSSFSAPVVAGTVGLLVQKARIEADLNAAVSRDGGNCVIKAILMNSATKLPFWHKGAVSKADDHEVSLDYLQGAGALNAWSAYEHLTAGRGPVGEVEQRGWDNNIIEKNVDLENIYRIEIADVESKFITATLVWNRHFADMYPFEALYEDDTDLRLEIWAVGADDSDKGYLVDYSDSISNNVEHVYCAVDPNYTSYEIVVALGDSEDSSRLKSVERYGLAWNVSVGGEQESMLSLWCDLNGDGKVNGLDFETMADNFGKISEIADIYPTGDINTDGIVNIDDASILIEYLSSK